MSDSEPQHRRNCRPHGSFCVKMKYDKIVEAKFIERENRFVARVELPGGEISRVHVKNTGRCRELLLPGADVYLEDHADHMGNRKMRYSLIAVEKNLAIGKQTDGKQGERVDADIQTLLINMDSQAPNKVVHEALKSGVLKLPGFSQLTNIQPEKTYGKSRFDFYVEGISGSGANEKIQKAFIEVKGVTLESDGFARFPDAPTERGVKHIEELCGAIDDGYKAYIVFVIQMKKIHTFGPNYETHPQFGEALAKAAEKGVQILAYDCEVTPDSLQLDMPVSVELKKL